MKKYIMPDSLTNELWPFTCPWTSESVCGRILSTILLWAKIRPLPVLNLQNSHEEICYAWFYKKINFDPSPVLDPQDLCVEVLYVLKAVEVSDGEHEQEPVPLPHILLPHRAELLLTRRVQYYKQGEKYVSTITPDSRSEVQLQRWSVLQSQRKVSKSIVTM